MMINRSTFMMSASAIICVCCGLSFADPATDSQDGKATQTEEQVQKDEQLNEVKAVEEETRQDENAAKVEETRKDETAAKADAPQQDENAAKVEETRKDETAAKSDENKKDESSSKDEEVKKEEPASPFKDPQTDLAFKEFNKFRMRCGLRPCEFCQNLQNIAQRHSNNMYYYRQMYHSGTRGVAENVFMGSSSGVYAVRVWMNSPGHRANMLGPYRRVGIARTGGFFTMVLQ